MNAMTSIYTATIARDAAFIGTNANRLASASRETRKAVAVYALIMAFSA